MSKKTKHGELIKFVNEVVLKSEAAECIIWPFGRNKDGYGVIHIDGKCRNVHRVVCEIAHGSPPTDRHHAAHLCGNGLGGCCNKAHLSWKTAVENIADKIGHGTSNRGVKNPHAKLCELDVKRIRAMADLPISKGQLASAFSVSKGTIYAIIDRKIWSWLA